MKTKLIGSWLASGLALALPWLNGCAQSAASAAEESVTNAAPAVVLAATNAPALAATNGTAPVVTNFPVLPEPTDERPVVPDPAAAQEKPLPAGLLASPSFKEVVRMANAGVDPQVMLSFITNSAGTFNLGADQIIYLKDIGISGDIVSTMIEHDQAIASGQFQVTASTVPSRPMDFGSVQTTAAGVPPATTAAAQPSVWQAGTADPNAAANAYAPAYNNNAPPPPAGQTAEAVPAAPQPTTVINNNYFQETLSPYGNWVNVEGYGNVWQPTVTVINTGWRPYMDGGRWLYTDAGWYWNSDYAWGCTFQYGRWFNTPRYGWCWWPNTVWAPAWVTWRSSSAYCGWAPLPPYSGWTTGVGFTWYGSSVSVGFGFNYGCGYYNWVPWSGVCSATPYRYRVPYEHARGHYNQSTVINNVIVGDNNTIINRGIDADHVSRQAGRQVPRGTIREVADNGGAGIRPDRVQRDGGQVVIERPVNYAGRGPTSASRLASASTPARNAGAGPGRTPTREAPQPITSRSAASRQTAPGLADATAATRTPAPEASRLTAGTARTLPGRDGNSAARTPTPSLQQNAPRATAPAVPRTDLVRNNPTQITGTTGTRGSVTPRPPSLRETNPRNPSPTATVGTDPRRMAPTPAYTPPTAPALQPRTTYTPPTVAARPPMTQPYVSAARPTYTQPSAPMARPSYTAPSAPVTRAPAPSVAVARPSYSAPAPSVMRAPSPAPSVSAPAMRSSPSPAPTYQSAPSGGGGGRGSREVNGR